MIKNHINHLLLRQTTHIETKRKFYDFCIDSVCLLKALDVGDGFVSVLGCSSWRGARAFHNNAKKQLLIDTNPLLPGGFVLLYLCADCGDLGCPFIKVKIKKTSNQLIWSDFYWEGFADAFPETDDSGNSSVKINVGPFIFDSVEYIRTIKAAKLCAN